MTALLSPLAGQVLTAGALATVVPIQAEVASDVFSASDGTTVAAADITGLAFAMAVNAWYDVEVVILASATDTTTDIALTCSVPAGATITSGPALGPATSVSPGFTPVFTGAVPFAGSFGLDAGVAAFLLKGRVKNGATAGNFQMRFARGTAVLSKITTVKAGTWLKAHQVK